MRLRQTVNKSGLVALALLAISGLFAATTGAANAATAATDTPASTQAAEAPVNSGFDVVVSPPSVGITTKPGIPVSTDIRIQNHGLITEHVKVTLMKFAAEGQDGTPQLIDLKPEDTFASWATIANPRFDAETNVWKTIHVTFTPPKAAAFGYYYAFVIERDTGKIQLKPKQANLLGAVASLVLLDVNAPGAIRQTKIAEFSTPRNIQEFLPVTFTTRMQNTGNTHVATRGNIFISRGGTNVAMLEVNLKKGYILPSSYRKFTNDWQDGTPLYIDKKVNGKPVLNKDGSHMKTLEWDKFSLGKLRFGKYSAKLVMVYDDGKGDISTEAYLSFWVIPWRIIGGLSLAGLLVLAGLWGTVLRPISRRLGNNRNNGSSR